jgi:GNAT superfamily N-acetyltransferase
MSAAHVERVAYDHPDAVLLRAEHVAFGDQLYASDPSAVHRSGSEGIDPATIVLTVVAYDGETPIGHACLRRLDGDLAGELEMKRLFVRPEARGSGVADELLAVVEQAARDDGAARLLIHTGDRQHAALRFYERHGYTPIPVFAPYQAVAYSLCFQRLL